MKKYVKPSVNVIELETMELMAGSQIVDRTGVGEGYAPGHAKPRSNIEWEE